MARQLVADGIISDEGHHQQAEHDPRKDRGKEEAGNRNLRIDGIDDRRDAGRNDRAEARRGQRYAHREAQRIAGVTHRLDLDAAERAEIGKGRAGHAGKHQAAQHVDVAEPTGDEGNERVAEAEDAMRHPAPVHQAAREDEQRDGQQRIDVDRVEQPGGQRGEAVLVGEEVHGAARADRQKHRQPQQKQRQDEKGDHIGVHSATLSSARGAGSEVWRPRMPLMASPAYTSACRPQAAAMTPKR